jgi:hypothetical protein
MYVKPQITMGSNGGRVHVMIGSKVPQVKSIEEIVILIPFSKNIGTASITANIGTVQFDDMTKVYISHYRKPHPNPGSEMDCSETSQR